MEINDTLKFKAFGWKRDYEQKRPHIEKVYKDHRQYYPPDAHGVIDEWQALIKNQTEVFQQEERLRKDQEYNQKEQYRLDLDRQMKEKKYRELAEKEKKTSEERMMQNKVGMYNQVTQQIKNMDHGLKGQLHDDYLRNMEDNRRKQMEAKQRDLMEDKNMIERDRLNGRNSQRAQMQKNKLYKQDLDSVADYHKYLKGHLAEEQKRKEDEAYLLACQKENAKRDKEQEDWFNRYKKFSNDMDNRLKSTLAQAMPTLERQKQIDEKINNDYDKYGNKLFDNYDKNRGNMDAQWRNAYNENQRHLKDKTRATQVSKAQEKMDMEHKAREAMAYNQNEEKRKREMEDQRNLYKETLQNQMTLNAMNKYNYGKMTLQEKHLNKSDLKSYKNKDRNGIHALIPGIKNIPSVGTKPLMRGAINVMDFGDSPPEGTKGRKGQMFFSPEPRQPEGFMGNDTFQHPLPHQPGIVRRNPSDTFQRASTPGNSTYRNQPISKTEFEKYKSNASRNGPQGAYTVRNSYSMASLVNPIVNPIDKSYKIYQH